MAMMTPWLSEHCDWTGHFWLPEDPDHRVPGVLVWSPDKGLSLSLIGGFQDRIIEQIGPGLQAVKSRVDGWPLIHGFAENSAITLLDCFLRRSTSLGFRPVSKQTIGATFGLIGVHIDNDEDLLFTATEIAVENLTAWTTESGLEMRIKTDDTHTTQRSMIAKPTEERVAEIDGAMVRLLNRQFQPSFERTRAQTTGRVPESIVARFEFLSPRTMAECIEHARMLQDLVSLASHRACGVMWQSVELNPASSSKPRVASIYRREIVPCDPKAPAVEDHDFLFTQADLPFEHVMPSWAKIKERFAAACNMILGLTYVKDGFIETQLMTAVGAVEAMHRAMEWDPPIPQAEFKQLKKKLLEAVPEERRQWLREKIGRNDPTLKDRLLDLAAKPGESVMALLLPSPEAWAEATKAARNNLAHTGASNTHTIEDLHAVIEVTVSVAILNLLHELGVHSEKMSELLSRNRSLRAAVRLAHKHWPEHSEISRG